MRLLLALLISIANCLAQGPVLIVLESGIRLRFVTDSGNGTPGPLKNEVKPASYNSVYRIFRDETGLAVYAYELRVDLTPDGDHFRLTAEPAGTEFETRNPHADGGKPTPTMPRPIESTALEPGGRFTIEIPTNPGLWEHRTDTVQIEPPLTAPRTARRTPPAKLRFTGLQVFINEKLVSPPGPGKMVAGQYTMFFLPRHGGYFFSTEPVQSSLLIGPAAVEGTKVRFKINDESFLLNSEAPILVESETGQVWVYYDPKYRPTINRARGNPISTSSDQFFTAASDSLSSWLQ